MPALSVLKPLRDCQLYAFVDTAYLDGRLPEELAQQLCDGGADMIQLRAKTSSLTEVRQLARKIMAVTNRAGVGLVINDHPAVAREVGAMGCHLGQEDFFEARWTQAKEVTGDPAAFQLGLSTHAPEQAQRALAAGPDYIAIGPVYATGTKPGAVPVTLEYVRWARAQVAIPWFAIGGITLGNVEEVLAAGAQRVAVVSAILLAADVAKACQRFKNLLGFAR